MALGKRGCRECRARGGVQHWVGPLARGRPGADPTAWGASVAQWRREARCPPGALPFTGLCPGETTQSHRVERPSPRLIIPGLIMPTSEMVVRTGEDRMFFPGQARPGQDVVPPGGTVAHPHPSLAHSLGGGRARSSCPAVVAPVVISTYTRPAAPSVLLGPGGIWQVW